jgi:hypothetical protein
MTYVKERKETTVFPSHSLNMVTRDPNTNINSHARNQKAWTPSQNKVEYRRLLSCLQSSETFRGYGNPWRHVNVLEDELGSGEDWNYDCSIVNVTVI